MARMSRRSEALAARGAQTADHRRLRHDQSRAARRGAHARPRPDRARPSPGAGNPAGRRSIVNPNRQDDLSGPRPALRGGRRVHDAGRPQPHLAPARLLDAARPAPDLLAGLDLVALATIADVAPLIGLNRAFVAKGLALMRTRGAAGPCGAYRCRRPGRAAARLSSWLSCSGRASMPAAASATPRSAQGCC